MSTDTEVVDTSTEEIVDTYTGNCEHCGEALHSDTQHDCPLAKKVESKKSIYFYSPETEEVLTTMIKLMRFGRNRVFSRQGDVTTNQKISWAKIVSEVGSRLLHSGYLERKERKKVKQQVDDILKAASRGKIKLDINETSQQDITLPDDEEEL